MAWAAGCVLVYLFALLSSPPEDFFVESTWGCLTLFFIRLTELSLSGVSNALFTMVNNIPVPELLDE